MVHPDLRGMLGSLGIMTSLSKRRWFMNLTGKLGRMAVTGKDIDGLDCSEVHLPGSDNYQVRTRIYRPVDANPGLPVILYIHGGGYIAGMPEMSNAAMERFIATRPCVVVAPDYRKAWTAPFPAGFNDCYDTLLWIRDNAENLGVDANKIIIAGHSAGGGLTAAVTLKARDTGDVKIAFQMPIYPMIDNTQPDDPARAMETVVWDTELNRIGWGAYLAGLKNQGKEIPAYAAPARNSDYSGFPPTITFVGDMEPFHQETLAYVAALREAGIEVAFEEYAGCFHAFDFMKPDGVSASAQDFTFNAFADFYDRFAS